MKSIRDFVAGKIRRSESGDVLSIDQGGAEDPELGAYECTLTGPLGSVRFFAKGLVLGESDRVAYEAIERVTLDDSAGQPRVDIMLADGSGRRVHTSPEGGAVLHATLRWIGNTQLRRRIAE